MDLGNSAKIKSILCHACMMTLISPKSSGSQASGDGSNIKFGGCVYKVDGYTVEKIKDSAYEKSASFRSTSFIPNIGDC